MAGPMWSGAIHDTGFVDKVLDHLEENQDKYGTLTRMKGMLTVAKEVRVMSISCRFAEYQVGTAYSLLLYSFKNS
jgi:tRNA G26 N,N-dimethylase Trm1